MSIKKHLLFVIVLFGALNSYAQNFSNNDLNGNVGFVNVPTGWVQIPDTDPICQAGNSTQATVDILDATGPNLVGGVAGIPQSGNSFCSGLHSSDNGALLWHEGIMQTVNGLTVGTQYGVSFYQTVVKQQNSVDPSGSWRVYIDGNLAGTSAVSTSALAFDDVNLVWDCRVINFTATATSHTIKFIPWDDDPDLTNSPAAPDGALRMGIDLITLITPTDPTITQVGPFCLNEPPLNLTAVDPGGTWSGQGIVDAATGSFDPSSAGVGNHEIVYLIPVGCSYVSDTITISVVNTFDAGWSMPTGLCTNSPTINLDAFITGTTGGTWSGNGVTGNSFDPAAGTSAVTYSVGVPPCTSDSTITITVNAVDDASFTYPQNSYCVTASNPTPTVTGLAGGMFSIDNGGVINANTGEIDLSDSGPGDYTITYSSNGACPNSSTFTLSITGSADATILPAGPLCQNAASITLNGVSPGGVWSASCGNCINSNSGVFDPIAAGVGSHVITYTFWGACGDSQDITIDVLPVAEAAFSCINDNANVFEPTFEFENHSMNASNYSWDFGDGNSSTEVNPTHTYSQDAGTYTVCLTALNSSGCNATTCKEVSIESELLVYVPNAFTPNGDGMNNKFEPVVTGHETGSYELLIFNRWGEQIFESYSLANNWDGTNLSGAPAKSDIYVWRIRVKSVDNPEVQTYIGHVTLLK